LADLGVKEKAMEKDKGAKGNFPVGHPSTGKNLDGSTHNPKGKKEPKK
jgi:hypothetical protein